MKWNVLHSMLIRICNVEKLSPRLQYNMRSKKRSSAHINHSGRIPRIISLEEFDYDGAYESKGSLNREE
jgi:hypothetical protein